MHWTAPLPAALPRSPIRCERAVAELRAGRPGTGSTMGQGQRLAVIALDSATASSFATFA
ncbi:GTP cyclohydrolase, partial [Stenotrophomonas maltophilia]